MTPYERELLRRIRHAWGQRERWWADDDMSENGQRLLNRAVDVTIKDAHAERLWSETATLLHALQAAKAVAK